MIEYAYKVETGSTPQFFLVTETPHEEVEAVLVVGDDRHDLVEFGGTDPDPPMKRKDGSVRPSRWGKRVGARVPLVLLEDMTDVRIEWFDRGTHVATYHLEVVGKQKKRMKVQVD